MARDPFERVDETAGNGKVSRRAFIAAAGAAAAGVTVAAVIGSTQRPAPKLSNRIVAKRRDALPVDDPASDDWLDADPYLVALGPQQAVPPVLESASVSQLTVEALHDGSELAVRLSWPDASKDELDGIQTFRDAVAIGLPVTAGTQPAITMGAPGQPMHLLQWRATWQLDVDTHVHQGVEVIHPRVVRDEPPELVLPSEVAKLFYVGRVVGNPLSAYLRESSVEEIVAEGPGSITSLPQQTARGSGVFDEDGWRVVIALPLERAAGDALRPGTTWPLAFALWAGSQRNRGGRKHFANWVDLELEA